MRYRIQCVISLTLAVSLYANSQSIDALKSAKPLYGFIENKGQVTDQDHNPNPSVKYILPLPNNNVVLRGTGFSYDAYITEVDTAKELKSEKSVRELMDTVKREVLYKYHRVDVEFVGANPDAEIIASEQSSDFINYYVGRYGQEVKVHHYGKLVYKNIYPGVDVEFIARPGQNKPVEYNFIVHPGAATNNIQLGYNGPISSEVKKGKIELKLAYGNLSEGISASYFQQSKKQVNIRYKRVSNKNYQLAVTFEGEINQQNEALVIDPIPYLDWGTYYGGTGNDNGYGVVLDANENIYITGSTVSTASIATTGAHQTTLSGETDAFVAKFNSSGIRQWSTYYGGTLDDEGRGVVIDASGNVCVVGFTYSTSSIATTGSHQSVLGGGSDAFVVKFNSDGARQWATYYGGGDVDSGWKIAIDPADNLYISGDTYSTSLIATSGVHQTSLAGLDDAFVVKFNSTGVRQWGTYYGGADREFPERLTIDTSGNIILTGRTESSSAIASSAAHQTVLGGGSDAFVAKFNVSGILIWGTYYGGSGGDYGYDIITDVSDNIYLSGQTASTAGIATSGTHQTVLGGSADAFIVKFNSEGSRQWATYYGGELHDSGSGGIAISSSGNIYFAGSTYSSSSIATPDAHQTVIGGDIDAFIVKLTSSNGSRRWGTYYGGSLFDVCYGLGIDSSENIFITGYTASTTSIATPGAHKTVLGDFRDAFIAKFSEPCFAPEVSGISIQYTPYICAIKFNTQKLPNCLVNYTWDFGDGTSSIERNPLHVYATPGTFDVSVLITYNCPSCEGDTTLTKQVVYSAPSDILEDRVIQIITDIKQEVISTEASSFSDAWALNHLNNTLDDRSPYLNGSQGVWRNNASFVYEKDRKLSTPTNIGTDGTFTMEQFNWKYAELNAVPNWIKANTMTRYSPYSYELENQDVLGIYSAAIYDYGGQLPAANGANMRNNEMAFTSFEYVDGSVAGNWIFSTESLPKYTDYTINAANKNMAIVEASLSQLENVTVVDVITDKIYLFFQWNTKSYTRNEIICKQAHPQNAQWSIIVLRTAPFDGVWTGMLRIKNIVTPAVSSFFDNVLAHTGQSSLKVIQEQTFKQDLLRLYPGKSYYINCWVSVNNPFVATPVLAANLGIDIIAKDKLGQVLSTFSFEPSGSVIEGWQQLKGSFICPPAVAYIEIKFKPGSTGTAWYDDLRLHPENGNMKGYVYNTSDFRLQAVLDEENFASYFYYDKEGNLYLTKKETKDGIKSLSENVSYQVEREP